MEQDLVVAIQFGGSPGVPPTSAGWPTHYVEEWVGMAHVFQSQLMSLIARASSTDSLTSAIVCVESGWTWLPSLMWRLDKEWKGLRREVPWVKRAPSEYIRDNVRFTLQPTDAPPEPKFLLETLEQIGSDEILLFSTDWPHWQYDSPARRSRSICHQRRPRRFCATTPAPSTSSHRLLLTPQGGIP